ncbi:hypothetical protein P152DRAFT_472523 [Eremomyces bilateralis CBS 781.70]|uniref:Uncharacterized protein n=1 Tax=Eremomyces bilateralis CBS 781.70 TaxID=1392243 RepID=A0A6G1G6X1_9PEZI|nr:uncharacterized protein P152DRAFT_472523 [Eremomyces bilateralis CBS 781.70]KAF1813701.1 hypothetical protein P152DRAFT_472523 [Eremomyces bilateralis CBS 781.70]
MEKSTPTESRNPDHFILDDHDSDYESHYSPMLTPQSSQLGEVPDLPPSYEQAQAELEQQASNLQVYRVVLQDGSQHAARGEHDPSNEHLHVANGVRSGTTAPIPVLSGPQRDSTAAPIPAAGNHSPENPQGQGDVRPPASLLDTALSFAQHTPSEDTRFAPRLSQPVVIPQLILPHTSTSDNGGLPTFARAYSKPLHAHDISPQDFVAFLDGLNALAKAPINGEVVRDFLYRANTMFFVPRGLHVRISALGELIALLNRGSGARGNVDELMAKLMQEEEDIRASLTPGADGTGSADGITNAVKLSRTLEPLAATLLFEVPEAGAAAVALRAMIDRMGTLSLGNEAASPNGGNASREERPVTVHELSNDAASENTGLLLDIDRPSSPVPSYHTIPTEMSAQDFSTQRQPPSDEKRPMPNARTQSWQEWGEDIGKRWGDWGQDVGKRWGTWGENFGARAEYFGDDIGRRAEKWGEGVENKFAGPSKRGCYGKEKGRAGSVPFGSPFGPGHGPFARGGPFPHGGGPFPHGGGPFTRSDGPFGRPHGQGGCGSRPWSGAGYGGRAFGGRRGSWGGQGRRRGWNQHDRDGDDSGDESDSSSASSSSSSSDGSSRRDGRRSGEQRGRRSYHPDRGAVRGDHNPLASHPASSPMPGAFPPHPPPPPMPATPAVPSLPALPFGLTRPPMPGSFPAPPQPPSPHGHGRRGRRRDRKHKDATSKYTERITAIEEAAAAALAAGIPDSEIYAERTKALEKAALRLNKRMRKEVGHSEKKALKEVWKARVQGLTREDKKRMKQLWREHMGRGWRPRGVDARDEMEEMWKIWERVRDGVDGTEGQTQGIEIGARSGGERGSQVTQEVGITGVQTDKGVHREDKELMWVVVENLGGM